jgi:hypothetical protein
MFASLMLAGFAMSAGPHAVMSAQPVRHQPWVAGVVEVLVNGSAQRRYLHEGRWYVEAVKGRDYEIRLRNPYPVRVAVALSVDGLNTIDARHTAAADARKWVLDPHETVTIRGWQVNRAEARRFEFTTEERSYGQALGKTANLGVISAVFYKERPQMVRRDSSNEVDALREPAAPPAPAATASESSTAGDASARKSANQEYAATGMGERTGHVVTQVWLNLESSPAQTMNIRYEFRPQLVRLGILPNAASADPLQRRERARGFEQGFSPEVR